MVNTCVTLPVVKEYLTSMNLPARMSGFQI